MGPFEIAAIGIVAWVIISGYKEYNRRQDIVESPDVVELKQELVKLQDRVATLETIVTDKSYQLGDQINRL